jgi:ABC-2 type transport system ATP-binding protein
MSVIECRELTKAYRGTKALNKLSCRIEENKITGLIGRNGAGKTTLLRLIAGHIKETSGEINVFSEHPFNSLLVSANVVFIHNQMNFPNLLSLKEILDAGANFYQNWDRELGRRLFDYFSFNPCQQFDGLSMGMKSTFSMIFGLASRCPLTIFDEPTTGMDAAVRKDFYRALLKDYIAHPRTILLSSHHLEEIEDLLEDILLLKDGRELLHMPMDELREYAVSIQGKTEAVDQFTNDKEILFSKSLGLGQTFTVIKNDLNEPERQAARKDGIEMAPVTAHDLCVYLTGKTKGGIDDVFK